MPGPDEICLSFSRFAISQPILMVEVSKCSSQKVRGGGLSAYFDRSSNKTTIGPQSRANGPDEICLSFSRFAISQPILMVEVSKCSSRKVRGGGQPAYVDRSSNKTAIGPQSRANGPDEIPPVVPSRVTGNLSKFF